MSKKSLSELFKRWSGRGRSAPIDSGARNRARLRVEEFEPRVVPAALPPVTASDTRVIQAGAFAPQAVADPTNPNLIVVVSASTANAVGASLIGQITRDGGQTWSGFGIANPDTGVNAGPGGVTLTMVNTPSVAFSRTGDLYIVWTSTTADQITAGRLRVASLTVQQNQPALGNGVSAVLTSNVLYQWLLQDPVYNPTVAVDNNLDEYTDPDTAASTLQDTMLRANNSGKAVYVAWNTNAVTPTVIDHTTIPPAVLGQFTPTAIFAAASRDRGASWTTPVPVNDGGFFVPVPVPGQPPGGGIAPQIRFTPGDLNAETTDSPGQLQFLWQTPGGSGIIDVSSPDEDFDPTTDNIDVEATTVYRSPTGPGVNISEPGIDPNNGPDIPFASTSKITVAINNSSASANGAFFDFLSDIDVTVALTHPHLNQISVVLIPPNAVGPSITLVANRIDSAGNQVPNGGNVPNGLADNNDGGGNSGLGVTNQGAGPVASGTVFSNEAARRIHDPVNVAAPRSATSGYIAHYRPEYGSLGAYYGSTVAELNGTWTLSITDFRDDDRSAGFTPGLPIPRLQSWSMRMSSLISNSGFGVDSPMFLTGSGGSPNLGGAGGSNTTATGFNAGYSFAYDNTLGSFSPFSGRMYTAFTNGNIQVAYSDDQGATWTLPTRVNDDFSSDNFSEGSRSNFMPSITVDPVTGTVVVMWYDARWDASNARVATYMATSIDGGDTWSVQDRTAFLNDTKDATDQLNRDIVALEPMPTNLRAIGTREAGQRQSVLAYGGQIKPFWTGNENAAAGNIYTATVQTSAGPRVVDNDTVLNTDQGAVTIDAAGGYNNTFTADGTRRIDGFTVTFDRGTRLFDDRGGVDVSTFTPDDVTVLFRAPGTDRTVPATRIPIVSITPLDPITTQAGFPDDATRFFVQFATPQSAVGTYSYSVGPGVSDRNRSQQKAVFTPPDTPTAIPDLGMIQSTLTVPALAGNPTVVNMEVKVDIAHTYDGDLKLTLFGPDTDGPGGTDARSVILSNRNGGSQNNYTNTRFNDAAVSSIAAGFPFASPPFTGTFRPANSNDPLDPENRPLATFNGSPLAGNWTLRVEDLEGLDLGTVLGWSITFLDAAGNPLFVSLSGTGMDQDGDSRTNEIGTNFNDNVPENQQPPRLYTDAYTAAASSGRDPFNVEPFDAPLGKNTLPLVSTGPHLLLVGNPGERAVVSFATRDAANPSVLHVTLDRAVDITTFDMSDVVAVVSTNAGPIAATLTAVRPTNDANEIASKFDFVYQGATLPTGKYSVSLGTDFLVADGMFRNTTSNQMLVRFDRDIDPASFTAANVLRITGPVGDIQDVQEITVLGTAGTFAVTFNNGNGPQPILDTVRPGSVGFPEIQTVRIIEANGGFTLTFNGSTTFTLPFDATAAQVQSALNGLPSINGVGGVVAVTSSGTPGDLTYTITFGGSLANSNVPQITAAYTTSALPFNIPASGGTGPTASLQNAIAALTNVGAGNVIVTVENLLGGGRKYHVTFTGLLRSNQPPLVAVGTAGTTATAAKVGISVTPVPTTVNAVTGGARAFFVTYPVQNLSGPYTMEFGQDPFGNSIHAVNIPQLATVQYTSPIVTTVREGAVGLPEIQTVRVVATSGAFTLTFNGATTIPLPWNATAAQVKAALDALAPIGPSGSVIVASSGPAGDRTFTLTFSGSLASSNVPQIVATFDTNPLVTTVRAGAPGTAEIQAVQILASSGTFTLTFNGATTSPLAWNSTDVQVKAALDALSSIGGAGASVIVSSAGSPGNLTYTITFAGSLANVDVPQIVADYVEAPRRDLTVVFDRDVAAGGFVLSDILAITGPSGTVNLNTVSEIIQDSARQFRIVFNNTVPAGQYVVDFGTGQRDEVQTVTVVGGSAANTFTLTFNGQTTNPIQFGAPASVVQTELNQLPAIGANGVTVAETAVAGGIRYTVTFDGAAVRSANQNTLTATGVGFADPAVATVQQGEGRLLKVANSGPAMDMNFNAGLDTLRGDAPTSQDLDPITYRSTGPVAITPAVDASKPLSPVAFSPVVTESYIVIDEDYIIRQSTLEQIRVLLNISHPDVRDLTIDLVPPEATGVDAIRLFSGSLLTNASNVASANFSNTLLVDRVGDPNVTNIENGMPPFLSGGSFYSPQTPLSALVGKSTKGVWTLRIVNDGENTPTNDPNFTTGDPVEVTNWTLTLPRALTIETQRFDRTSGVVIEPRAPVVVATTQQGTATLSEIQTLTVSGSSGSFNITYNGATTGLLPRTATASQVQAALNSLSSIAGPGGSVTVTSLTIGTSVVFTVTFRGTLANTNVQQMTTSVTTTVADSSITIPVDFTITESTLNQIQMLMNITHPNVRELDIDLIPPVATGVGPIRIFDGATLAPTASNVSANFTNTRLVNRVNSPTAPSLQSAVPPFNAGEAGFFSPQTALTALIGKSSLGTWTLRVTNRGTNAPGNDPNFNPNVPVQIVNWSLTFPKQIATTGLGQATADRFQAAFRIFTQDPTNTLTQTTWTPVGPAPTNETANAARISAMAVDPTDPTGNTVYVAVAGGGIWKTTDFLNATSALQNGGLVPRGPSYVPLTDFGPTSAVNVSSIALFPRNNDPHQTIVYALTGEPATEGDLAGPLTQAGVGVIRSLDGGKTWQVLDSVVNVDAAGNVLPMAEQTIRNHLFVGATGHKIIVDPTPGKDGGVIVYMALSGNVNQNGLWRSLNGGNSWTRIMAGNATDVVLAAGSANQTDPATGVTVFQGNLQKLYAAFRSTPIGTGPGVYKTDSAPAAFSLDFMAGGTANPLIQDVSMIGSPQVTTALPVSFPNSGRRMILAAPSLSGDPLKDSFLKDWLYVMGEDGAGSVQLWMTKDSGAHWTRVRIPNLSQIFTDPINGTNNEELNLALGGRLQVDVNSLGDYTMALAVDPVNPYIVYMSAASTNSIRIDTTKMRDAHNFTFYNNSNFIPTNAGNPAFTTQINNQALTIGGLQPRINFNPPNVPVWGDVLIGGDRFNFYEDENGDPIGFLNLYGGRDYNQPFTSNSLIRVENTSDSIGGPAGFFVNDGADISWSPFSDILDPNVPGQTGSSRTQNRFSGINTHTILSFTDPVTGKTRLIFGTDDGVFTGVDSGSQVGTGTLTNGIGFSEAVRGNRNGNLQTSQFYSGAVQTSQLAADLAGALFYGMGDQSGFPVSSPNVLASGDLNWRGPTGHGASVLVDQAGSGTAFEYRSPNSFGFDLNLTATGDDFFRVMSNTSDHAFGGGFSRTGSSSGSLFDQGETWPDTFAYDPPAPIPQPSANPVNPNVLMFGSPGGRVYRSTDQGVTWVLKATPGQLDNTDVLSTAFGSSDPAQPTLTNNFLYAGTQGGQIYSTTTGGAPWRLIGSPANGLDGQDVIRIVPNPQVGKKDVFALTTSGVFYKADGTVLAGNWVPLVGNLFNLTRAVFGNPTDLDPALRPNSLTALAVDWRYAIPQPNDPTSTFPYLYVAGDGGVFRSTDFGTNWTFYPDVANDNAPADGGYLPNTHITDLDLSIGDLDPTTGRYKPGGFNMLVATTYGRGTFAIRLDPDIPASSFVSGPRVTQLINPNPVGGPSAQLNVRFSGPVDPATFTPADVRLLGPGSRHEVQTVTVIGGTASNTFTLTFNGQTTIPIAVGSSATIVQAALNQLPAIGTNGVSVVSTTVAGGIRYTVTFDGSIVQYTNQNEMTATGIGIADPTIATVDDGSTPITITSVTMISTPDAQGVNPRNLFAIRFPTQAGIGSYDVTIGHNPLGGNIPLISDPSGFLMNQDNDTVNGEPIVDQYRSTILLNSSTNNRLVVASSPASAVAGESTTVVIEARDSNDLLLNGVNGTLTLTPAPGTGTFTPSTAQLVNGVASFTVVFQTSGVQTVNVSFPAPPNINTTSWSTTVVAGAASQFVLTPASTVLTAPSPQSFTLTAQDQFGNTATSYNQTVTITRTGAAATLPATVDTVNGVATINGVFNASGNVQITATGPDPANPPSGVLSGTANVTVNPGLATQLGVSISPGPYSVGTVATVTVSALDSQGNVANNLNGMAVTRVVAPGSGFTLNPVTNPVFTNGVATYTITFTASGAYTITHTTGPLSAVLGPIAVSAAPPPPSPTDKLTGIYGVGSGVDGTSDVTIFNGNGTTKAILTPFPAGFHGQVDPAGPGFLGGVRVAVGDVTGDGVPDYVMGTGPTITAAVVVYNGKTGAQILDYQPFETFQGGVFVTVGDITGDGINEIVMTPDEGGGPRVTILRGGDFSRIGNFFGINDPNFRGGARPAVGDLNGDGFAELVVSAGFGGGPRISVFDGAALAFGNQSHPVGDFFLFEETLRNGAYVAVGDVNGDGFGDLVGGAGPGGGPRVLIVSGKKLLEAGPNGPYPAIAAPIANFFAGNVDNRGGIRVAVKNIDGDRKAEVVTGSGGTDEAGNLGGSTVSIYLGADLDAQDYTPLSKFDLLPNYFGGVFVG